MPSYSSLGHTSMAGGRRRNRSRRNRSNRWFQRSFRGGEDPAPASEMVGGRRNRSNRRRRNRSSRRRR